LNVFGNYVEVEVEREVRGDYVVYVGVYFGYLGGD